MKKNSIYNLVSQIITVIAVMSLIPLILVGFGSEKYGIFSLIILLINSIVVFDLGINKATIKYVSEYNSERKSVELGVVIVRSVVTQLVFGFIILFLILLIKQIILESIAVEVVSKSELMAAIVSTAILVPILFLSMAFRSVLEGVQAFDVVSVTKLITNISAYIVGMVVAISEMQLNQVVIGITITRLMSLLVYIYFICNRIEFTVDIKRVLDIESFRKFLTFSIWIAIFNILVVIISNMDRWVISSSIGAKSLTYYVIPYEILYGLWIFPAAIMSAIYPVFCSMTDGSESEIIINKTIQVIIVPLTVINLTLSVFSYELMSIWQNEQIADATRYILPILLLGHLINSAGWASSALIISKGGAKYLFYYYLLDFIVSLLLLMLSAKYMGIMGVAVIFVLRSIIEISIMLYIGSVVLGKGFQFKLNSATFSILSMGVFILSLVVVILFTEPQLRIKGFVFVVFVVSFLYFSKQQVSWLYSYLHVFMNEKIKA